MTNKICIKDNITYYYMGKLEVGAVGYDITGKQLCYWKNLQIFLKKSKQDAQKNPEVNFQQEL